MPATAQKQLDYLMIFIKMFADSADISEKQAFNYLDRHKGIEFVRDHYDVIHTLDFDYAIEDIDYRNGWISEERMREIAKPMLRTSTGSIC